MPTVATAILAGVQSLSRALGPSTQPERMSEAVLIPLEQGTDRIAAGRPNFRFQYFPDSFSSSKQTNWQQKEIPGGSLPIYQFVSGGEHVVSFTAVFSCDTDLLSNETLYETLRSDGLKERNPDLRTVVAWLRQFELPSYRAGGAMDSPLVQPPQKLVLLMPGTGIGLLAGNPAASAAVLPDSIYCQMTQCEVSYQALFPSGLPRYLEVQLAFAQTAQYGGSVQFPGVTSVHGDLLATGGPFKPYQLLSRATPYSR